MPLDGLKDLIDDKDNVDPKDISIEDNPKPITCQAEKGTGEGKRPEEKLYKSPEEKQRELDSLIHTYRLQISHAATLEEIVDAKNDFVEKVLSV